MDPISAISSAGLMAAQRRFDTAATRIVRGDISPIAAVNALQGRTSVEAQVKVLKAADDMTGRLLDIFA